MLIAIVYSLCAVALDIAFSLLNPPDKIRFFHPVGLHTHTYRHFPDFVKGHFLFTIAF